MAFTTLWSVLILSAISTSRSEVTLLSLPNVEATINAQEGETVRFVCSSANVAGPEILQINNNIDDVRSSRITFQNDNGSTGTVYELANITRDDNATLFQCFVNAVPSNYLTLIVDFPPKYFPDTYNYTVIEGTPLRIPLRLDALKAVTSFSWTKDDFDIQSDAGTILGADFINFGQVGQEDAGSYQVIAEDNVGMGTALLNLIVYYPPEFVAGSGIVNRSVVTGSDLSLNCSWSSNPSSNLELTFEYVNSTDNVVLDISQIVTVTGAVAENEGRYICTANNTIAVTQLIFFVAVGALPTVVVVLEVSLDSEAVILRGTYEENNFEDPVIRFYVTVNDMTVTAVPDGMSGFSVSLSYDQLEQGTTYTVYIVAENAIGNGMVQEAQMFTIPANTTEPSGTTSNLHMVGTCTLAFLLALVTAILL